MGGQAPVLDCAGVATIVFPDWAALEAFFNDPENIEQQKLDGPKFTDQSKLKMAVGDEILFI
jgi:hypothetical protein